jgi:hypothetical protein
MEKDISVFFPTVFTMRWFLLRFHGDPQWYKDNDLSEQNYLSHGAPVFRYQPAQIDAGRAFGTVIIVPCPSQHMFAGGHFPMDQLRDQLSMDISYFDAGV